MNILLPVLLALASLLLPLANAFAQSDQLPPTAVIVHEDFSPIGRAWQPVTGHWTVAGGTYGDDLAGSSDITTLTAYRSVFPADPGDTQLRFDEYTVRARVRNQSTGPLQYAGIVYNYQDSQNYYEAVIAANGIVQVRKVIDGAITPLTGLATNIGTNTWCELEVHWDHGFVEVKINGMGMGIEHQTEFTSGQVGLVTHGAVARFDKLFVGVPFGDREFFETFSTTTHRFAAQSGVWSVTNGSYGSGVQQTSISLAPILAGSSPQLGDTFDFTFAARLVNPYGGAGNLVGIVFNRNFNGSSYVEVVFSPTGVAKINRFQNGVLTNIATDSYVGARNVPFDLEMQNGPNTFTITVDGKRLFPSVTVFDVNPDQFPTGAVGLITHWAPGKFDNIRFDHFFFEPCSLTFDNPPLDRWVVSGTWNATGGTLNDTSAKQSDIVDFGCLGDSIGDNAGSNAIYRARVRNGYAGSGNLFGLIYNYQNAESFYAGDYYEIVFSGTGVMQVNKFLQGVRYPVVSRSLGLPRNTFFNVEVGRSGIITAIKVNGVDIIHLSQGELRGGSIGVISHWARGSVDDVTLVQDRSPPATQ